MNLSKNNLNLLNSVLVFLFIFISALPFALIGGDALHDGLMLKTSIDIWSGKMIFKETYSYYGVVSPLIHSWFMNVLGNYLSTIRIATAIFYALSGVLLFNLWNKFCSKWISLLALISWVLVAPYYYQIFYPWPSVFAMFFVILTIYLYVKLLNTRKNYLLFLVGISSCLAFLSKQSYLSLFALLFILEFFLLIFKVNNLKDFFKNSLLIFSGFLFTFLIFISWIYLNGAMTDYWLQVIRQGYTVGKIVGGSFVHNFISCYRTHPYWLLIYLSTLIILIDSIRNIYRKTELNLNLVIFSIAFLSLASYIQVFPTVDPSHTYWAVAPGFIFIFYLVNKLVKIINSTKDKRLIIILTPIIIVASAILVVEPLYAMNQARISLEKNYFSLNNPSVLKNMRLEEKNAEYYQDLTKKVDAYLITNPKKIFIIDVSDPIYLTFTDKTINVIPIFSNFSGYSSGYYNFDKAIDDYVIKNKPLILVDSQNTDRFKNYYVIKIWGDRKTALVAPK